MKIRQYHNRILNKKGEWKLKIQIQHLSLLKSVSSDPKSRGELKLKIQIQQLSLFFLEKMRIKFNKVPTFGPNSANDRQSSIMISNNSQKQMPR